MASAPVSRAAAAPVARAAAPAPAAAKPAPDASIQLGDLGDFEEILGDGEVPF